MSDDTLDLFGATSEPAPPARPRTGMDAGIPAASLPGKQRATMARATDPAPSHDTADHFAPATLSRLQGLVLAAVGRRQPVHARDLERDPAFADLGPSTVRKRVTELVRAGLVERHDEVRVGRSTLTRWRLSRRVTQHTQAHTDPHLADTEAA